MVYRINILLIERCGFQSYFTRTSRTAEPDMLVVDAQSPVQLQEVLWLHHRNMNV